MYGCPLPNSTLAGGREDGTEAFFLLVVVVVVVVVLGGGDRGCSWKMCHRERGGLVYITLVYHDSPLVSRQPEEDDDTNGNIRFQNNTGPTEGPAPVPVPWLVHHYLMSLRFCRTSTQH